MSIIAAGIEQHVEKATFLWFLRDAAVHQSHYSLYDLALLDNRVDVPINGLRIAGDEAGTFLKETLAWKEAGEVFAGAVLAFETGVEERMDTFLEAGSYDYELSRSLVFALVWLP